MKVILGPTHMRIYKYNVLSPSVKIPNKHMTANSTYIQILVALLSLVCYCIEYKRKYNES